MLNTFPFSLLMGTLLGVLSGLGTGGGSLLILWLTLAIHTPQSQARLMNLLFFLPSALVACLFRWKQGRLDIKKVLPAMLAGSISAGVFAFLAQMWDPWLLKKAFGILLLITGIRELLYKPRNT